MRCSLPIMIVCVAGLVAGWMAGKQLGSAERVPEDVAEVRHGHSGRSASRSTEDAVTEKPKHDLSSLIRTLRQRELRDPEMAGTLERMSVSELKELLTAPIPSEDESILEERQAIAGAASQAAVELYRREGVAALEWADALEAPDERRRTLSGLIQAAARDHPEIAKPWIERFIAEHGDIYQRAFTSAAIIGATSRGADDLIRLWELFGGNLRGNMFPQGRFPEDFDFHKLVMELPRAGRLTEAVTYWAAKDPEVAWAGAKQAILEHDLAGTFVGSIHRGVHTTQGEEAAAAWAARAISELPPEKRGHAVGSLMSHPLSPEAVGALMDALPDEEHRRIIATRSVFPHRPPAPAVAALERMPAAERVEAVLHP